GPRGLPAAVLPRTVCICTEQPGMTWFNDAARVASHCGAVFDVNARGVELLRARGIRARRLRVGYTPLWDRLSLAVERDVEIAFLGGATDRRERILGRLAGTLIRRRCRLVLADNSRTNPATSGSFLAGEDKLELLARTRVLLNVHRHSEPYFEWVRALEAIHCGAAVVSEWSRDYEPLIPGEHFLSARPESIGEVAALLLVDEGTRERLATAAHDFIRERLPLRASAESLADAAETVASSRLGRSRTYRARPPEPTLREMLTSLRKPAPKLPDLGGTVKRARLEVVDLNRRLDWLIEQSRRGTDPPELEEVAATPAHAEAVPRVSVICALFNQAGHVQPALSSVLGQGFTDWELVVTDDGSTDGSGAAVERFMAGHPDSPALLLRHPVNRGLPAARNAAASRARGEYVLVLDSDNELYPHCLERLVEALDAAPDAAFAYGILEQFDRTGPVGLSGYFGWEPERLVEGNYIDALALLRRSTLAELGGYTDDRRLYGWEDYDLWCRIAERGSRAAHVPEILARYRLAAGSMISITNVSTREAREALAERCPRLFEGVDLDELEEREREGKVGFGHHRLAGLR
ncbi:MAG TPA: glycosyltransferase, partial [Solirubrobacterales bacterium]|nr:glycosyltransferase [Solirubrobacterales bacterium]